MLLVIDFVKKLCIFRYTTTASALIEEACLNTCQYVVCDNVDLDTILIEYENYYYLRYQKKPKISKSLDVAKSDTHVVKSKLKQTSKKNSSNQHSQDIQSMDMNFITVTPINGCKDILEEQAGYYCSSPSVDLSYWKDEWQAYAEIISKVIITGGVFRREGVKTYPRLIFQRSRTEGGGIICYINYT